VAGQPSLILFSLDLVTRHSFQWPKLLGSFLGLEAIGIFMVQARLLFWHSYNTGWPDAGTTCFWLIFATSLSLLAYFSYRAHNWARLTVIALCASFFIFGVYSAVGAEISWARMQRESGVAWEVPGQIESAVETFGSQLSAFLAPLAFVIGVLCHRDVSAAFRRSPKE
jgi:hypothetical protein